MKFIAICITESIRCTRLDIKALKLKLSKPGIRPNEITNICLTIESLLVEILNLENSLKEQLEEINIIEEINSFNPKIYTTT